MIHVFNVLLRVIGVIWISYPVVPIQSRHSLIRWLTWTMGPAHILVTVKISFHKLLKCFTAAPQT